MPFDSAHASTAARLADRLSAMGIQPVSSDVVTEHKNKVIRDFSTSMRGRSLVRNGAAVWQVLHIYRDIQALERPSRHLGPTIDISAAPQPIIQLARRISRELKEAEFEIEWFYTDPVVNVVCGGQRACLGIWDRGRIVAIAQHDGYVEPICSIPESPREAVWKRVVNFLLQRRL